MEEEILDIRTPRQEVERRHRKLWPHLESAGLDMTIVISNPNLYYLTGSIQEGMVVLSPHLKGPVYMVRRVLERARFESPLDDVRPMVGSKHLRDALGVQRVERLGIELSSVPHSWVERIKASLGGVELFDVTPTLRGVRSVKSDWEVDRIQEASLQVDRAMERAREVLREGMTELELAAELEREMRHQGHEGLVRMHRYGSEMHVGGVLSGPSATIPTCCRRSRRSMGDRWRTAWATSSSIRVRARRDMAWPCGLSSTSGACGPCRACRCGPGRIPG